MTGPLTAREEIVPCAFRLSDVERHNQSLVSGSGPIEITTPAQQWAYAVTVPFRWPTDAVPAGEILLVRVEAEVHAGRIGIGCVSPDLQTYVATEVDCAPADGSTVRELLLGGSDAGECGWLVVRNTADGNEPSRVTVRSIRTFRTHASRIPDLVEADIRPIPSVGPSRPSSERGRRGTRKFRVALTHTSRQWDRARCSREYLVGRFSNPTRLLDLPPFDALPAAPTHLYSGAFSILELAVDGDEARISPVRCIDSPQHIQHVTWVGSRLVLCFESFLAVLPTDEAPLDHVDLRPGSPLRIDDNWFSALHTVFPVNDDVCMVSSSGADAVLWVDLRDRRVIRRWRLPSDLYGVNYELTPEMSVNEHYIPNESQLGHLNCAYPDGQGGCYVSTLIQGDVGHVDDNGRYSPLARGYVGCHGVRLAQNGRDLYFADSCGGRLMGVEPDGSVRELWSADSQWLHDAAQVDQDLYLLSLSDRNELALVDVTHREERGRFTFDGRGVNVQFVTVASDGG